MAPFGPEYNDLWEYNPATNNWRYIKGRGNLGNTPANYGLQGIANHNNLPSLRWQATAAASGNSSYIYGGLGGFASGLSPNTGNVMNDLWKWVSGPVFTYGSERKLYVNDNSMSGDIYTTAIGNNNNAGTPSAPLATLDFAVSIAQSGDTIFVDAGTYLTPNFTIGKAITILGTNYNISPNDNSDKYQMNLTRNEESRITGSTITIGSDNISILGMRFFPSTTAIGFSGQNRSNITLIKNLFNVVSSSNTISFSGASSNPIASKDIIISDNRFQRIDGSFGATLLSLIKKCVISNNVFIETGSLIRRSTAISTSTSTLIDSSLFEANHFKNLNFSFRFNSCSNIDVLNNKLDSVGRGIQFFPGTILTKNINVLGNEINNTRATQPILIRESSTMGVDSINIANNIINHGVENYTGLAGMIHLEFRVGVVNGSVTVWNNKIHIYGDYTTSSVGAHPAILISGSHRNTSISSNELNFSAINTRSNLSGTLPPVPTGVYINTDADFYGPIPSNAIFTVENNSISGFKNSIGFYDPNSTGQTSYVGYGQLTSGVTVNINNNSFTGDSISINNGTISQTVNATCNWYGGTSAQAVLTKVKPSTVNYTPWLTNGTDSEIPTVGFQPMPDVCNGILPVIALDAKTDITCFGTDNGTINVTVTGGVGPFTYAWTKDQDPLFSSTDEDLSNLEPGTYYLLVTDANGSVSAQLEVEINEPELLTASADGTNNLCYGVSEGSATVTAGGGTIPYSYMWSNGETTETITGLAAGVYNVTVTDANGCTANTTYEVTHPNQLVPSIINNSTACSNIATATALGGTGSYIYEWSNGFSSSTISNVPAGSYSVTITDENGCTAITSIDLVIGEAFNPSASVIHVSCFNANNGSIIVTNANGTSPFSLSIDGINFVNNVTLPYTFNTLVAGIYTITVVDANGCTGFVTKMVTQPTELVASLGTVNSTCFALSTGSINVSVSGGSPSYSYNWSGTGGFSSSQLNINNLATGSYNLTVTDKKGCTALLNAVVTAYPEIVVVTVVTHILCKGQANGSINLTVSGGTGSGFTYLWNNNATTEDRTNLGTGNYNVTITDIGSGCTVSRNFTITQPATTINLSATKVNVTDCNLGTITATGSGGTPYPGPNQYLYSMNGTIYQTSGIFTGVSAGSYTVWVKDANGCTKSAAVTITDNGSDQYESNNSKNQAKSILFASTISARLAIATDVADWFKFTTPSANAIYTLVFNPNSAANFTFNMYVAGNNTPALVPVPGSITPVSKSYSLSGNTTYYISVTGGLSYSCYQLAVSIAMAAKSVEPDYTEKSRTVDTDSEKLKAIAFPNPHQGNFTLQIESPETGMVSIQLLSADGRMVTTRNVQLFKGKSNTVTFTNMKEAVLFYRVRIGNHSANGKIIGPE